jgi:hypothetical protein
MFAAKAGRSTLGIPKSVAIKFVSHDKGGKLPPHAKKPFIKGKGAR